MIENVLACERFTFGGVLGPLSVATTETMATPEAFGAGVNRNTPFESIVGCAVNKAGLSTVVEIDTVWLASSSAVGGLLFIPSAGTMSASTRPVKAPESSSTAIFLVTLNPGGSFTGVTERVKVDGCDRLLFGGGDDGPLSTATTTILTEPLASLASVKLNRPAASTAGRTENIASLLVVTSKETVCALGPVFSSVAAGGPAKMFVAQGAK